MQAAEAISMAEATIHLVAGCVGANDGAQDLVRSGFAKATVAEIRKFIEEQLANPALDVELICKKLAFRAHRSTGFASRWRRSRAYQAAQACALLSGACHARPNPARISQIGFRWDFQTKRASAAHSGRCTASRQAKRARKAMSTTPASPSGKAETPPRKRTEQMDPRTHEAYSGPNCDAGDTAARLQPA